ncbi:hypothetical protein Cpir12675_001826 [Ceratocystis pirilliformis]|uniref:Major facilitator superfamily (MFS) profile domain-containing protein n=1 Tax=Ceratocystis pirilliformis TaxID=259994 RepID=A0ABR3ZEE0_9PEZI
MDSNMTEKGFSTNSSDNETLDHQKDGDSLFRQLAPDDLSRFEATSKGHIDADLEHGPKRESEVPHPVGPDKDTVPDGGFEAWFQCFGSWVIMANTWGVINCYGVYQTFYARGTLFDRSPSDLSWIGSLQSALLLIVGSVVGPLYDAGHFRAMMLSGVFLILFGLFMVSLSTTYWQVMLSQGLCVGLGCGLAFLPSTAILSQYFDKHLGLAIGISSTGSPVAGIILPIMFGQLEPKVGFARATRYIAVLLTVFSIVPVVFMRTRVKPIKRKFGGSTIKGIFKDIPFLLSALGLAFAFMTMYVPYFYIQTYAINKGITTKDFSPYLITIVSAGSILGRVIPNYISDKAGPLNVMVSMVFMSLILASCWMTINSLAGMIAFCAFYGMASGGVVSGTSSVVISLSPSMDVVGTRIGFLFTFAGLATLVGPPVTGALIGDNEARNWKAGISWVSGGLALGWTMLLLSRVLHYHGHKARRI